MVGCWCCGAVLRAATSVVARVASAAAIVVVAAGASATAFSSAGAEGRRRLREAMSASSDGASGRLPCSHGSFRSCSAVALQSGWKRSIRRRNCARPSACSSMCAVLRNNNTLTQGSDWIKCYAHISRFRCVLQVASRTDIFAIGEPYRRQNAPHSGHTLCEAMMTHGRTSAGSISYFSTRTWPRGQ